MDSASHILYHWLLDWVLIALLLVFIGWLNVHWRAHPSVLLSFTRRSEVPKDHPMIEIKGNKVHYVGGQQHPLPTLFHLLNNAFVVVFWFNVGLCISLHDNGVSFLSSLAIAMGCVQLPMMAVLFISLRRLQPKWIREHLAKLPVEKTSTSPKATIVSFGTE